MKCRQRKPTAPGWYWRQYLLSHCEPEERLQVVRVYESLGRLFVASNDSPTSDLLDLFSQAEYAWAGPLDEPVELVLP